MSMLDWARKEIEIACKKENPNWDGNSFDYSCACYQSALKAYESLCNDQHSGFSWGMTINILNRLAEGKPLTPITDNDFYLNEDPIEYLDDNIIFTIAACHDNGKYIDHKTHEKIAADIGSSREVVSRSLKSLEKRGILELGRGKIKIINWIY